MEQYPHILKTKILGDIIPDEDGFPEVIVDEDGFPIDPEPSEPVGPVVPEWTILECREVPNNSGDFVNTDAGEKSIFTSKIYLPLDTEVIPTATEINVFDHDGTTHRISGRVIRFARYQLNCVLWV